MHPPRSICLVLVAGLAACGKPVDRSGQADDSFHRASMTIEVSPEGSDRPLAADFAVIPVSMLVMFNRLKTPEQLQETLNRTPGQFSHLDLDSDEVPDPLTVLAQPTDKGHAFEIRARPATGEFVVATLLFDPEWDFLGHYSGTMDGVASTRGQPLAAPAAAAAP